MLVCAAHAVGMLCTQRCGWISQAPKTLRPHLRNVLPWMCRLCMSVSEPKLAMCQRTLREGEAQMTMRHVG